ncbi:uncharacterized protein LOC129771256 [Toxorhynchites rutilus septentrionalis]|uniref:uncharacterized protein LOC129771256 n=1 Tax=Toxorhynchites rutilus septentrionalis TaxID=329112 RepID=UPI00247981D2|nr:uncharacterized protein LOC129771256 [Toxorhynchites rutilus septentrionalis]
MNQNASMKCDFLTRFSFLAELRPNIFVGFYAGKFKVEISLPMFPETSRMNILVYENTDRVDISQDFRKETNITAVVNTLMQTLDARKQELTTETNPDVATLVSLLHMLNKIKQDRGCKIFTDGIISKLKFTAFKANQNHFLEMSKISGTDFKVTSHSLPDLGNSVELFKWNATPEAHCNCFVQVIDQLEEFYSNLYMLDELCCVVDPPEIDTRTAWRIIKLNHKVFLKITLHPLQPSSIVVAFIGPTLEIEKPRELYHTKIENWDPESNVYTNLLRIFEMMSFPMPNKQGDNDSDKINCGICMSYRDGNKKIPIVSCDNEKCSLIFHVACLKQWFFSLEESKTFFAISIGTCPYCRKKMSSSFDELLNNAS